MAAAVGGAACGVSRAAGREISLLNVSYDPTRELYQQYNAAFAEHWRARTGDRVTVQQSHGGSGRQSRAVVEGREADVVTLALSADIDQIAERARLLPLDWQGRLPHRSTPYYSTIVFLVRLGNPRGIRDWEDLAKPGVQVITPNPKSSGGARWNYLAAWAHALRRPGGNEAGAKAYLAALLRNVPVMDTGARGSTLTFIERGIGDVLLAWENEALLAVNRSARGRFEVVVPSSSIRAEPPVAVVDAVVDRRGTRAVAQAYLEHLYSDEGQRIVAENFYRPVMPAMASRYASRFPGVRLHDLPAVFGSWRQAQKVHFSEDGLFDQIYAANAQWQRMLCPSAL
nr:sulfate ABC transporter substrate-binding protein [Ideonella livida]